MAGEGNRPDADAPAWPLVRRVGAEVLAYLEERRTRLRCERHEMLTQGFDDMLQLQGGFAGTASPTSLGIKIPTLPSSSNGGLPYLALCAVCDLDKGEAFVGFTQYLSMAALIGSGDGAILPPFVMYERECTSAAWTFQDTPPVAWWVTIESLSPKCQDGPWDMASFSNEDSDTPAMLYTTPGTNIPVGGPIPGYLGLNAYAPPQILGQPWYVCRDLHYPLCMDEFHAMRYVAPTSIRVRIYAQVTQTDPTVRDDTFGLTGLTDAQVDYAAASLDPETSALQVFPNAYQYRSVGCRMIVEKFTRR